MSTGTIVKLVIRPIADSKVEILQYFKKKSNQDKFKRVADEEGKTVEFKKLGLRQSYDYLFG